METQNTSKGDMNPALGRGNPPDYQEERKSNISEMRQQSITKGGVKRERAASAARRTRIKKIAVWITACAAVVIAIWTVTGYSRRSQKDILGEQSASQGQQHVALDYQFDYNSNPPTSGPHYRSPANWGAYDYEVNDKIFIHNMEHGGIWIAYKPSIDPHVVEHLKSIMDEFGGSKIVMAPRAANDSDIAVAAWTHLLKVNLADGDITDEQINQIRAFYKSYKNKGPEFVPDTMPGIDPRLVQ